MNQHFECEVMFRPWGTMDTLLLNEEREVTIKYIHMFPGQSMSLQSHKKRDQLYVIIEDNWNVTLSYGPSTEKLVKITPRKGQVFSFPHAVLHRMENKSYMEYSFIEISLGHNDESDITRHEDSYGRNHDKIFTGEEEQLLDLSAPGREASMGPRQDTGESSNNRGGPWIPGIDP